MNTIAILRKRQVEDLTGRSYSSLRRDMQRVEFPMPVQIGPRAIGWRTEHVQMWLDARQVAHLPGVKKPIAAG